MFENVRDWLVAKTENEVILTFGKVERLTGRPLSSSYFNLNTSGFYAYKPLGRAIVQAGFNVVEKHIEDEYVKLRRFGFQGNIDETYEDGEQIIPLVDPAVNGLEQIVNIFRVNWHSQGGRGKRVALLNSCRNIDEVFREASVRSCGASTQRALHNPNKINLNPIKTRCYPLVKNALRDVYCRDTLTRDEFIEW